MNLDSDNLTIRIDKQPIFPKYPDRIVARHVEGRVHLYVGMSGVDLSTVAAHKVGLAIAKATPQLDINELIVLEINKERFDLPRITANQVSTALLRKADAADDYQLNKRAKQ